MRRLDRVAGQINPFLFVVVIGLLVLYLTYLVALMVRLPVIHLTACVSTSAASAESEVQRK
jgi:hypothetical protein